MTATLDTRNLLDRLRGGLIVSCQARADNPVHGPVHMAAAAQAALRGGAVGIRAEGTADISAIRTVIDVPILGIRKILDGRPVYITPDFASAAMVVEAGADIVALDATLRDHSPGDDPHELIRRIRGELGVPVMADIDTVESGVIAVEAGADLVATTLAGYTLPVVPKAVDLEVISALSTAIDVPVLAEGRIWSAQDVTASFEAGAWAVVVGTAITNPWKITERLAAAASERWRK